MENIFKSAKHNKSRATNLDSTDLSIKNLSKSFLIEMKSLSQIQKINLAYEYLVGKKPDSKLDTTRKLNRILFEYKYGKKIKHTKDFMNKKKNRFRMPFKWNKIMKMSNKKGRQILVWYLNRKGNIEPPKLHPLYASDMIIIRNKPHEVDPRAFWRFGKYQCLLIKEIDRRPVSNLDYEEIKKRGDSTDSDEFIIKAAMKALVGQPKKKPLNRTTMIIIGVIILVALIFFMTR